MGGGRELAPQVWQRTSNGTRRTERRAPSATVPAATISGGLDALVQLIECCVSKQATATTLLALMCLPFIREALPRCVAEPGNMAARAAMSMAASISGICLANAGLGMAHGIAAALGMVPDLPHGMACGLLLLHVLRFNQDAATVPMGKALAAFLGVSAPRPDSIDRGRDALGAMYRELGVPGDLQHLGLSPAQVEEVAAASMGHSI